MFAAALLEACLEFPIWLLTEDIGTAGLVRHNFILLEFHSLHILCRFSPVFRAHWLSIRLKVIDLQEVEAAVFILYEITHKHVQRAFSP